MIIILILGDDKPGQLLALDNFYNILSFIMQVIADPPRIQIRPHHLHSLIAAVRVEIQEVFQAQQTVLV
jgi:hypothetical protein